MRNWLDLRGVVGNLLGLLYHFREDMDSEMLEMLEFYLGKPKLALQGFVFDYNALIKKVKEIYF